MNTLRNHVLKPRSALALSGVMSALLVSSDVPRDVHAAVERMGSDEPQREMVHYSQAELGQMDQREYTFKSGEGIDTAIAARDGDREVFSNPQVLAAVRTYIANQAPRGIVQANQQYDVPRLPVDVVQEK